MFKGKEPLLKTLTSYTSVWICLLIQSSRPSTLCSQLACYLLPSNVLLAMLLSSFKQAVRQSPFVKLHEICFLLFIQQLENKGKDILAIHLKHLMTMSINDPDWCRLRKLLEYLTDVNDVANMTAEEALRIVEGLCCLFVADINRLHIYNSWLCSLCHADIKRLNVFNSRLCH